MDNSLSTIKPVYSRSEMKRVWLRLAVFFLVLLTSHFLVLWLHPMGAHAFFWNLALGGCIVWLLRTVYSPLLDRKRPVTSAKSVGNSVPCQ
jgi:hypothetical protein